MIKRLLILSLFACLLGLIANPDTLRSQEKSKDDPAKDKEKSTTESKETKVTVIKALVPRDAEVELTLKGAKESDDRKLRAMGEIREFKTPPLAVGKKFAYTIEALIIPNNYTKITRTRTVNFVGGTDVTVDFTKEDKDNDKIVVRWVATPDDIVDEMAKLAKIGKDDVVYDLGCGDGVMLIRPVKLFGAKKGVGIDIDDKMVEKAKDRVEKEELKGKIEIRQGDILKLKEQDLADATVVMLYIGDDLGKKLEPLLRKTMKPGSRIVSHRFGLGDWQPDKTVTVQGKDGEEYKLLLWEIGGK